MKWYGIIEDIVGFYLLLQNQELRPCNFSFYKKETETKEQQKAKFVWGRGMGCVYNLHTFIGL